MIRKFILFLFIIINFSYQKEKSKRKWFYVTVVNSSVQCDDNYSDLSYKYPNRKYSVNQDTIKVFGLVGLEDRPIIVYQKALSEVESQNFYNYLQLRRIDTLEIKYVSFAHHYCIIDFTVFGESLPSKTLRDENISDPALHDILVNMDKLIPDKYFRMYRTK